MTENSLKSECNLGCCLIIIDSDQAFTARLASMFEGIHQCLIAPTGELGMDLLDSLSGQKGVFVVCGSDLPDMSALDVCSLIKKEEPQVFFVLFSHKNDLETRIKGLIAGADNCVGKDIVDEELELLVSNVLRTLKFSNVCGGDAPNIDDISDEIFCALEAEVRSFIELYYQLSSEQRQGEECSSRSIAERLGLSQRSFQRAMKSETGYTFKQLHLIVRLEEAQKLLAEGYNVNQVTDLLSFSSPAHLSSAFKDEFGIRPSKYRYLVEGA